MKPSPAFLAVAALALLLAGCPAADAVNATDQKRLDFLVKEPLVAEDPQPAAKAGSQVSDDSPPKRGQVLATLSEAPGDTGAVQVRMVDAMASLRVTGWTVYFAYCVPPTMSPSPPAPKGRPVIPPGQADTWTFGVYAYKHADGVSYFAALTGTTSTVDGRARVVLELLAPSSHEKQSDVFADKPPAIGGSCLDTASLPTRPDSTGTSLVADTDGPDPQFGAAAPDNR